jgi:LGFP repeat
MDAVVTSRQTLVESDLLPFSLFIDKGTGTSNFNMVASVKPDYSDWGSASTQNSKDMKTGIWYTADLVFDLDTVAVFIDGIVIAVYAFPESVIIKSTIGKNLYIGTWTDGSKHHFSGKMAMLQWYNDEIPAPLVEQITERRNHPEWFLTFKYQQMKNDNIINLGLPQGKYSYDVNAGAYVQLFDSGLLMYNQNNGVAFEMHGAIYQYYKTLTTKAELGYLVSDEKNTLRASGRKNLFSKAGIYWSTATGAFAVAGQIYIDYEGLGESNLLGWPTAAANTISGGKEQVFQLGRMYFKTGAAAAFEVHGSILNKFISLGGTNICGFPVSNETDIKSGASSIGKCSEFEKYSIYYKEGVGAFEVHGDIRSKYKEAYGPVGQLGFPTTDETNVSGVAGARYNLFQNGSIVWFGSMATTYACMPFNIYLDRIETIESEDAFMGSNDTRFRATVTKNGLEIFAKNFGEIKDKNNRNVQEIILNAPIVPNKTDTKVSFTLDIWEVDNVGGDDHLGVYKSPELCLQNAWGLHPNNGIFSSGKFSHINNILWNVQLANTKMLKSIEKWWGVENQGSINKVSWSQFTTAFNGVDTQTEDWDILDWLDRLYYEIAIEGGTKGGNCFGMALQAVYAYKNRSLQSLPLNRFTNWGQIEHEINIKHIYQFGMQAIIWAVGQFFEGNTHNPVDVFNASQKAHLEGCDPLICISQDYFFMEKPHCILPIAWDKTSKPWKMTILDPNFPSFPGATDAHVLRTLFVDPDKNEYVYEGNNEILASKKRTYKGDRWLGGRFHYMPLSVLNRNPKTPVGALIDLITEGVMHGFSSTLESTKITDEKGVDLNVFGADATNLKKQGKSVSLKYAPYSTINGNPGTNKPRLFFRADALNPTFASPRTGIFRSSEISGLTLHELLKDTALTQSITSIKTHTKYNNMKDRILANLVADAALMTELGTTLSTALKTLCNQYSAERSVKHELRGIADGNMSYFIRNKLNSIGIQSTVKTNEVNTVELKTMQGGLTGLKITSPVNKTIQLKIGNKFGSGKDFLNITIDNLQLAAGKSLELQIRSGLGNLEVLTAAAKSQASIRIEVQFGALKFNKLFNVEVDGGLRLNPISALSSKKLRSDKIKDMYGSSLGTQLTAGG